MFSRALQIVSKGLTFHIKLGARLHFIREQTVAQVEIEQTEEQQKLIQQFFSIVTLQQSYHSQEVDYLASLEGEAQLTPEPEKAKITCRKSTFQINEKVLNELDKLHLTLQLELGKANAPYKEVIVEEALVRLLEQESSDRSALISVLLERQKSRDV